MSRRHTDLLDRLTIASPCSEDWNAMNGNDRVRFCSHCEKSVHNLSEMTRSEALMLVKKSQGRLCVRYYPSPTETVQTLPLHSIKRRASRIAAGAFTATLSLCSSAIVQASSIVEPPVQGNAYVVTNKKCTRIDGQTKPGASLAGTVLDPNGALVPAAVVTLIDEKTKQEYSTRTDDEGIFEFKSLPAGSYTLRTESPGFVTSEIRELILEADAQRRLEVGLQVYQALTGMVSIVSAPVDALVKAASEGNLGKVKELLAAGHDVNIVDTETDSTALMEAVGYGNHEMVRVLLSAGAEVDAKNRFGRTALMTIGEKTSAEIVWTLVSAGAAVHHRDNRRNTPLLVAAMLGNASVVQAMLDAGAKVNAKNENGKTALMLAAVEGHLEVVRVLLAAGANVNRKDGEGETALALALDSGQTEIAELLESHGAHD